MKKKMSKKTILLIVGIILLFSITLGSAILSSLLSIEGNTTIKENSWIIYFDSVRKSSDSVASSNDAKITNYEKTRIDFSANLKEPGDFYEFTVYTVNDGTIDAMVDSVEKFELTEDQQKYLDFSVTYDNGRQIKRCDPLDAGTRKRIKAIVKFKDGIDLSNYSTEDVNLDLYFDIHYVQKDDACPPDPTGNEHILTLRPHGGTYKKRTDETRIYIEPGQTYEIEDPTRYLYNFTGWEKILPETEGTYTFENNIFTMGDEDVTLEAQWEEGAYVARIMNKYYTSIQEAFDAVDSKDWEDNTVYLLKNQNEDPINNATNSFVFNLGGYNLTGRLINPKEGNIRLVNGKITAEEDQPEAVINYGAITLGTQGGGVQVENSIAIIGNEIGLRNINKAGNYGNFYFYDGYIEAVAALVGGYSGVEEGYFIFSEHIPERNDQRVYLVRNPNRAVAKTTTDGVIYYYNLQDAINQASINKKAGELPDTDYVISAVRNFEAAYKLQVKSDETIIFDLDGHTVSTGDTITNNGNFTIKNTAQTAAVIKPSRTFTNTANLNISNIAIKSTTDANAIDNTGNLNLQKTTIESRGGYGINNADNGTIAMDKNTTVSAASNYGINNTGSNLILTNGNVYGVNNAGTLTIKENFNPECNGYTIPVYNSGTTILDNYELSVNKNKELIYNNSASVIINGGNIINDKPIVSTYYGTITLNDVNLKSTNASAITGSSTTILNSGTVESTSSTAISCNSFTMNNGTVTGIGTGVSTNGFTMKDGTINSDGVGVSASSANISGGTINSVTYGVRTSGITLSNGTINTTDGKGIEANSADISGGTVNATTYGMTTNNLTMTDGSFNATNGVGILVNTDGTITGGNIFGEVYGVQSKNKITLGVNEAPISSTSPVLVGNLYGLYLEGNDNNFYDGILKGQTDGYYGKITGLPTGGLVIDGTEEINEITYNTDTVNAYKNWLQVGDDLFNNIESACDAIESTGTITVIDDADVRFIQQFINNSENEKNITFDLNGHTITTTQPIYNHTKVTIVDSSNEKDGKIIANRVEGIVNENDGELTINSGYFETTTTNYAINNNGVMTVNAAYVTGPNTPFRTANTLTVNDITIENATTGIYLNGGSITYNGGNITATDIGISKGSGTVTVNGGTIYGTNYGIGGNDGNTIVNDGLIKAKTNNAIYTYYGETRIKGGQVISEENIAIVSHSNMYVDGGYVEGTKGIQNEQYCSWYSCWYNNIDVTGGHVVGKTDNGIYSRGSDNGQLTITGGVVEGQTSGVYSVSRARIGANDNSVSTTTPVLIGHTDYGLLHTNYTEFYDGILKGIKDGHHGLISIIPDAYLIKDDYEYIDRVEYQTDYLVEKGNWLRVGNKEFNSINKANQYITEENHTMTVIADAYVDFEQAINANYDVVFDFNGHSLIMTQPLQVKTNTRFTNTREVGGINNLRDNTITINNGVNVLIEAGVYHSDVKTTIVNSGNLTINDGEVKTSYESAISSTGVLTINNGMIKGEDNATAISCSNTITVNGGTIYSNNQTGLSASGTVTINNGIVKSDKGIALSVSDAALVVNNGTITSTESTAITTSNSYYGTTNATINNGEISGYVNGINDGHSQGEFTINGGHIVGTTATGVITNSTSHINGGNMEGGQYGLRISNSERITYIGNNDGTINIDSPIIKGDLYGLYVENTNNVHFYDGTIKGISGRHYGVINTIATRAQIFEDEEVINETTYYTEYLVTETDIVINENTNEVYGNLQNAITQAQDGETLRLLTNVPLYYEIAVVNNPNITLNMDGYTISTNKPWRITVPFTITNTSNKEATMKISTAVNLITTADNLTINNVTLKNNSSSNYVLNNTGKLYLNNIKIDSINGVQSSNELNINNSTIRASSNTISNTGKMTINGGTYTGGNYSLYSNSPKTVNISNASFYGVTYNSGSNTATMTNTTVNGNLQNYTSNLTVQSSNINTGRVTNNGTMTLTDSTFTATTTNYDYYYYQDIAMANSGTLTLNHSNVMINKQEIGKSSIAISNTGELNVTNDSKVYIGLENTNYTYQGINTSSNGITTISDSEIKVTGGHTNYGVYTNGAGAKTIILTGSIKTELASTSYGSYIDKGTFEMGHYEGQGVEADDVSTTNPLVQSEAKSRGIGVKKVNASFNFYDGIIRASKYSKPETTTNVEYQFEVTTYVENDTGYEYAILEWMRNDYQGDTVCLLNDVYYKSVQDAIDKAEAGDEIVLLKSVEENLTIPTNKNFKLNLNQHSITTKVTNNGTFNVYNGSLQSFDDTTIVNKGTLILGENDNTVSSSNIRIVSESTTIQSTGTIIMYDGYIEGTEAIDGKINQIAQYSRVRTVHDEQSEKKFIQSLSPEAIQNGETDLIITIDPNNGLYEESKEVKEIFKKYHETYTLSTPTKRGCNFIGWELSDDAVFDEQTNTITVDISDVTATAKWEVSSDAVAKVGEEYYLSLQEALDNASDNDTVELLKNTTEDITNKSNVKLDLGGYKVTGAFINQGELRIVNGTIENPSGVGMINQKLLTMGENDGEIHEDSVQIIGTTVGLQQDAIFRFYDGYIEGDIALNGRVDSVPKGYFLYNDRNNTKNCQRVYLIGNPENAVATIENGGTQYFFSLQSAIDTATITGDEIFIVRDFEAAYAINVPENADITINMSGYNITTGNTITNNGTLRIHDSSEEKGSITIARAITNNGSMTVEDILVKQSTNDNVINSTGSLDLKGTTINAKNGYAVNSSGPLQIDANTKLDTTDGYALYTDYEDVELTGGEINGIYNAKNLKLSGNVFINSKQSNAACVHSTTSNAKLIMNGGTCNATNIGISLQGQNQSFEMNDGTITSRNQGIYVHNYNAPNTVTINDGEVTSNTHYGIYMYGVSHELNINDGYIKSEGSRAIYLQSYTSDSRYFYNANIAGGTIEGTEYGVVFDYTNLNITGGEIITTSTSRDRYALYKYGGTCSIKNATLTADTASGIWMNGTCTLDEGTKVNASTPNGYGVAMEAGTLDVINGAEINTPGTSATGVLMSWYNNATTVNVDGGKINSGNIAIDTNSQSGERKVNIKSGLVYGETYGINLRSGSTTVNIGQLDDTLSKTDPIVSGGIYGIYKTAGTSNFYSGRLKGYVYGYNELFNNVRKAKDITEEIIPITENEDILTYSGDNYSETPIEKYAKAGNGYAKITYVGDDQATCTNGQTWTFDYIEGEEEFIAPCSGNFRLEVWGAAGGYRSESQHGGYGGYSTGKIDLDQNEKLYINVGGQGQMPSGAAGYNGGGYGGSSGGAGGGGGATHIATSSGLLSTLANNKSSVIIVAGGGGGFASYGCSTAIGGSGGGFTGAPDGKGGTQTAGGPSSSQTGGSFGQGGYQSNTYHSTPGGGSGWYGGGTESNTCSAGGGSGYIANERLTDRYMYGYQVPSSKTEWVVNYLVDKDTFLQVEDVKFNQLEDAENYIVENLNGTGTIKLIKNAIIQEESEFIANTNIIFDLNGKTLTTTKPITNNSVLTITDNTEDKLGKIYNKQSNAIVSTNNIHIDGTTIENPNYTAITCNTNEGTLTVDNNASIIAKNAINTATKYTIIIDDATIQATDNGVVATGAVSTLSITDTTITATNDAVLSTGMTSVVTVTDSSLTSTNAHGLEVSGNQSIITVNGGTYTAQTDAIRPTGSGYNITISDATLSAQSAGIAIHGNSGTVNIENSNITGRYYGVYMNTYNATVTLTNNTIKSTAAVGLDDVNGGSNNNNVTVTGGTIEGASNGVHLYNTNLETNDVTIRTNSNNKDNYCIYTDRASTVTLNTGTKLYANNASGLRNVANTTINDVDIQANNNAGYGITNSGGVLNIYGGTIYSKKYGIYQDNANAVLNLGDSAEELSIQSPLITSDDIGLYKTAGKTNFYSGRIKGANNSYDGEFNKVRKSHSVYTFDEVIDEQNPDETRQVSYLTETEAFLQVGDDPNNVFASFEDALDFITETNTATIKVLNDKLVYEEVTFPSGKTITLELNDHQLSFTQTITNNGILTINGGEDLDINSISNANTDTIHNKGTLNINNISMTSGGTAVTAKQGTGTITITDSKITGVNGVSLETAQPLTITNTSIKAPNGTGIIQNAQQETRVTNSTITAKNGITVQSARNQRTILNDVIINSSETGFKQNADGTYAEINNCTITSQGNGIYQYDSDATIKIDNSKIRGANNGLYTYGYRNTITISNSSKLDGSNIGLYHDINTGSDYTTITVSDSNITGQNYGAYIRGAEFNTAKSTIKTLTTNKDYYAVACQAYSRCKFGNDTEITAANASGLYVNTNYEASLSKTKVESNAVNGYALNVYDGIIDITNESNISSQGYQSYGIYQSDYDSTVNLTNSDVYSKNIAIMVGCNRNDTKKLNINSGTIIGENYGISQTCTNNTTTIGNLDDEVSVANPHIEGGLISINKTAGTLNFYSGLLKGYVRGNPGTVDNVRTGYEIFDDEDEAMFYIRSKKTLSTTDHSEVPISNNSKEGNGYAKITYEEYEEDNSSNSTIVDVVGGASNGVIDTSGTQQNLGVAIETYPFEYVAAEQEFTVPYTGYYRLETWGAQGGSISGYNGGYGGYATGEVFLEEGTKLYINVGGSGIGATTSGQTLTGGYNGGGTVTGNGGVNHINASGGGATHIATKSGLLSTLEDNVTSILIASGGGGGARDQSNHVSAARWGSGGSGGGYKSSGAYSNYDTYTLSQQNTCIATQESGYLFGQGENVTGNSAGGGGFYGGYSGASSADSTVCGYLGSGSGGSGYIGNSSLSNKHMACYECESSDAEATKTISNAEYSEIATADSSKVGDGAAVITYLGSLDREFTYTGQEEVFVAPTSGYYQLETWGAQGGNSSTYKGGYGAYSTGKIYLNSGDKLYINVGGQGGSDCVSIDCEGGYNGGGASGHYTGDSMNYTSGGGGATSITKSSGLLKTFSSNKNDIIMVAAGGGGAYFHTYGVNYSINGGSGGGIIGSVTETPSGFYGTSFPATGGTQTNGGNAGYRATAGAFGEGGLGLGGGSGGGSGLYGGGGSAHHSTGGGSSYIGNSLITDKHMTCYNCETSDDEVTKTISSSNYSESAKTDYAKEGDGAAKIRYIGNVGNVTIDFDYTGEEETYTIPTTGYYLLETWGAQGGSITGYRGGYGSYSTGKVFLNAGDKIYINVGGQGESGNPSTKINGGYNGGGYVSASSDSSYNRTVAGGGGATHIATTSGQLSTLEYNQDDILIVSGGGGGGYAHSSSGYAGIGGDAGGVQGKNGTSQNGGCYGTGATQDEGGAGCNVASTRGLFGTATAVGSSSHGSAGGGGYYGGGSSKGDIMSDGNSSGGGGSGYIGNRNLSEKHMTCYECTESDIASTKTISNSDVSEDPVKDSSKIGNGYARITFVGGSDIGSPTHKITLNTTIGTLENSELIVNDGEPIGQIPQPTIEDSNLVFDGWYLNDDYTKKITEETIINMSTIVYAKFIYSDDYCSNLAGNKVYNFDYTGEGQELTIACPGKYKIELWGAQGGDSQYNSYTNTGGYGGYTVGVTSLKREKKLYIYVGGKGNSVDYQPQSGTYSFDTSTGYNGGGYAVIYPNNSAHAGGGGATHIATREGLLSSQQNYKSSVLMVSGGGGGASTHSSYQSYSGDGGSGGGAVAGSGVTSNTTCYNYGTGGTQNSVGTYLACTSDGRLARNENRPNNAAFGKGSNYSTNYVNGGYAYSGGGAGWYGGESGYHGPGGGGSSYISLGDLEDAAMYGYNIEESFTENKSNIAYLIEKKDLIINLETNEKYLNVQDAIDEANDNEVLQYISNDFMSNDMEIPQGKHIIIDMNGFNIVTSKQIINNGTLTLKNDDEEHVSKVTNNTTTTLIINNGILTFENIKLDVYNGIENGLNATLNADNIDINARNIGINNTGKMTLEASTIYGATYDIYSNSTKTEIISNTTLKDSSNAYYKYNNGDTTITGSTVRGTINNTKAGQPLDIEESVITSYIRNTGTTTMNNNEINTTMPNDNTSLIYNTGTLTLDGNDITYKTYTTNTGYYTNTTLENRGTAITNNNDFLIDYDYNESHAYTSRIRYLYQIQNYGLLTSSNDDFISRGGYQMFAIYNNSSNASTVSNATITQTNGGNYIRGIHNEAGTISLQDVTIDNSYAQAMDGIYIKNGTVSATNTNISIQNNTANSTSYGIVMDNGTYTHNGGNINVNNIYNAYGAYINNGEFNFENGRMTLANNTTSYGVYMNSQTVVYTQGIYDGRGTEDSDVSETSPYISAIGTTTGIGVRMGGGTFNYYDGYITGSTSPRQEGDITSRTELNYQVSTKLDENTGYNYCILEYNK